jgi:hypothetical protein
MLLWTYLENTEPFCVDTIGHVVQRNFTLSCYIRSVTIIWYLIQRDFTLSCYIRSDCWERSSKITRSVSLSWRPEFDSMLWLFRKLNLVLLFESCYWKRSRRITGRVDCLKDLNLISVLYFFGSYWWVTLLWLVILKWPLKRSSDIIKSVCVSQSKRSGVLGDIVCVEQPPLRKYIEVVFWW